MLQVFRKVPCHLTLSGVDAPPILLGMTMWIVWRIRSTEDSGGIENAPPISPVSIYRLKEIGPRLEAEAGQPASDGRVHQLVRFNLYNFGEGPVNVCAVALTNTRGLTLRCELLPAVAVGPGARYPMMIELADGPVTEAPDVETDVGGQRAWIGVRNLPES